MMFQVRYVWYVFVKIKIGKDEQVFEEESRRFEEQNIREIGAESAGRIGKRVDAVPAAR